MLDELAATLASIQEFMVGMSKRVSHSIPFHLSDHCETAPPPIATVPPPIVPTTNDTRLVDQKEATRQRSDKFISSFVSCWRAKVVGMVDWPKEQNHIDMVLRNLQPRFDRRLMGIPF
ncbi:hypothetical protein CK203_094667 [Vitis vinifera]|uniref:Uncharacterized protein n=1 Tax=Vitis vinifera TaxID=29760 RepID=A0A438CL04_VITVI|nr:hypothetical protein CK203_094667 [Vitis vinifera]